jgi:hypothetical protein
VNAQVGLFISNHFANPVDNQPNENGECLNQFPAIFAQAKIAIIQVELLLSQGFVRNAGKLSTD